MTIAMIEGLGVSDTKAQDVLYVHADGAYGNPDYNSIRVITIPYLIRGTSSSDAFDSLTILETAWAPSLGDVELILQLPGWGTFVATGRPRGLVVDLSRMRENVIRALARFDCLDPTLEFVA